MTDAPNPADEVRALRRVIVEVVKAIGNGSFVTEDASVAFLQWVPEEVRSAIGRLSKEAEELRKQVAAERHTREFYEGSYRRYADVADEVFQDGGGKTPVLPDFLIVGEDKAAGYRAVALAYKQACADRAMAIEQRDAAGAAAKLWEQRSHMHNKDRWDETARADRLGEALKAVGAACDAGTLSDQFAADVRRIRARIAVDAPTHQHVYFLRDDRVYACQCGVTKPYAYPAAPGAQP